MTTHVAKALVDPNLRGTLEFFPSIEDQLRAQYPDLANIRVTEVVRTDEGYDTSSEPFRAWYRVSFTADCDFGTSP